MSDGFHYDTLTPLSLDHPHTPKRPLPSPRSPPYCKRHASFDSPREVPLPSPLSQLSEYFPVPNTSSHIHKASLSSQGQGADPVATLRNDDHHVFERAVESGSEFGEDSLPSAPSSPKSPSFWQRHPQPNGSNRTESYAEPPQTQATPRPRDQPHAQPPGFQRPRPQPIHSSSSQGPTGLVFPFSRPYSLPQGHSTSAGIGETIQSPKPIKASCPDRSSSASLPLPMQTPYYTLPQVATSATLDENQESQGPPEGVAWQPPSSQTNGHIGGESDAGPSTPPSPTATRAQTPPAPHRLDPSHAPTSYAEAPPHPLSSIISAASSVSSFPAPEVPVILTPPPPPTESGGTTQAPYEPFLCHNAVSEDRHSIAVETSTGEYRLVINLPGFSRDAM